MNGWFSAYLKKPLIILLGVWFLYIMSYIPNSIMGGYYLKPEMDGCDKWSFGLSVPTAIMWQPRWGHYALGHKTFLGAFYEPLIVVDRHFFHPTQYVVDPLFVEWKRKLTRSNIHPEFRDAYSEVNGAFGN